MFLFFDCVYASKQLHVCFTHVKLSSVQCVALCCCVAWVRLRKLLWVLQVWFTFCCLRWYCSFHDIRYSAVIGCDYSDDEGMSQIRWYFIKKSFNVKDTSILNPIVRLEEEHIPMHSNILYKELHWNFFTVRFAFWCWVTRRMKIRPEALQA